jgi:hypothetical protein
MIRFPDLRKILKIENEKWLEQSLFHRTKKNDKFKCAFEFSQD